MSDADAEVREAIESDLDQILAIEQQADLAAHWPRTTYESVLRVGNVSEPRRVLLVAHRAGQILGFAVVSFLAATETSELENIAVSPTERRAGIGQRLLRDACDWARIQGASRVDAEVRESNVAALDLYFANGFRQTARRGSYYQSPEEDALLLALHL